MAAKRKKRAFHKTVKPTLSLPEIRFCQFFASGIKASPAYVEAEFPGPPPASDTALWQRACEVLRKPQVRAYIQDLRDAACEAAKATIEELARGFQRAATADLTMMFGKDDSVLSPRQWPMALRAVITSIEVEEIYENRGPRGKKKKVAVGRKWKIKVENKTEARKVLAQWRGMIGQNADKAVATSHPPLVVGGEANPGEL